MRLFAIGNDDTITAFSAAGQIPEGQEQFASEKELVKLSANWPADRLAQVWNSFAGVAGFGADLKPVKKFTDRKTAAARIWKAIQTLDGAPLEVTSTAQETAGAAPRRPRARRKRPRRPRLPGPRTARPRRARAARRPSCWTCCAARMARRWPRSPKPPAGRTIMPTSGLCRPVLATRPVGRGSLRWSRHNQRASRKASSLSVGRKRPGFVSIGAVLSRARSLISRSACR